MSGDLDDLTRNLLRLAANFDGPARMAIMKEVRVPLERDVERAVRGDIGDLSMSGWRRGKPVPITPTSVVVGREVLEVKPAGKALGVMRTLSDGRNPNGPRGPKILKSGKVSKAKQRRYNGRTRGKGTWGDATELMADTAPRVMRDAVVKVVGEVFRG